MKRTFEQGDEFLILLCSLPTNTVSSTRWNCCLLPRCCVWLCGARRFPTMYSLDVPTGMRANISPICRRQALVFLQPIAARSGAVSCAICVAWLRVRSENSCCCRRGFGDSAAVNTCSTHDVSCAHGETDSSDSRCAIPLAMMAYAGLGSHIFVLIASLHSRLCYAAGLHVA